MMITPKLFAAFAVSAAVLSASAANAFPIMNEFAKEASTETSETANAETASDARAVNEGRERVLQAGPVRMKFVDGELRYLYVGDKEVVRRIYFAVRDADWDTAPPVFDRVSVRTQKNSFTVELSAHCTLPNAGYKWTGKIVGTPDGKIAFTASGEPNQDFKSNRLGLCVLYGAPSLAGQAFETVGVDGKTVKRGTFPLLVSPSLVATDYQTLRYQTPSGLRVSTGLSGDAKFDMEDQRTYSDSSYKAFATLDYNYATPVKKGDRKTETVTVSVSGASQMPTPVKTEALYTLRISGPVAGAVVPQIGNASADETGGVFGNVNGNAAKYKDAKALTWGYNPSLHLPDSDTYIENAVTVKDQVKTAHTYAPGAKIRISPITFDSTHPRTPQHDARSGEPFGDMWTVLMVKNMSLAGVDSAGFGRLPSDDTSVQKSLAALAGKPVLETLVSGGNGVYPAPVEAFAIKDADSTVLFVMNKTNQAQTITVPTVPGLRLKPYEVVMLRVP